MPHVRTRVTSSIIGSLHTDRPDLLVHPQESSRITSGHNMSNLPLLKQTSAFDPRSLAQAYARSHKATDSAIVDAYYFPADPDDRIVRILYVNNLIAERNTAPMEPYACGVDDELGSRHEVQIIDLSARQFEDLEAGRLKIADGWNTDIKERLT
jgi:hypothetical protein